MRRRRPAPAVPVGDDLDGLPAELRRPFVEDWATVEDAVSTMAKTNINGQRAGVYDVLDAASLSAFVAHRRAMRAWFEEQQIPAGGQRLGLLPRRPMFRDATAFADRVRRLMAGRPADP